MELPEGSEYVALGSSFTAGPGLGDRVAGSPRLAARSAHNYPHVLATRLGLRLSDMSFSGATVAQIVGRQRGPRPKVNAVGAATRLVTMTAGGNDLGYIGYLIPSSAGWPLRALLGGKRRLAKLQDPTVIADKVAGLERDLASLFEQIRSKAPEATIVVTDYLTIVPADATVPTPPLSAHAADQGRAFAALVTSTISGAASKAAVIFADVSTPSADHHAWSANPWVEGYVLRGGAAAAYHPRREGMIAVADAIEAALKNA
jgi:lysophospholipase L1-like esterase